MPTIALLLALLTTLTVGTGQGQPRAWHLPGRPQPVRAQLLDLVDDQVCLLAGQDVIRVDMDRLPAVDQQFVRQQLDDWRQAAELLRQAADEIQNGQFSAARSHLRQATRLDGRSLPAPFALGMLAWQLDRDVDQSAQWFAQARHRGKAHTAVWDPDDRYNFVAVCNNLALLRVRQRRLDDAIALWDEATGQQAPDAAALPILHNLQALQAYAVPRQSEANPGNLLLNASLQTQLQVVLARSTSDQAQAYDAQKGWLYMTVRFAAGRRSSTSETTTRPAAVYEDVRCLGCAGSQKLRCPEYRCRNGTWRGKRTMQRSIPRLGTFFWEVPWVIPCPTCEGRAVLTCPFDTNGIDQRFPKTKRTDRVLIFSAE